MLCQNFIGHIKFVGCSLVENISNDLFRSFEINRMYEFKVHIKCLMKCLINGFRVCYALVNSSLNFFFDRVTYKSYKFRYNI